MRSPPTHDDDGGAETNEPLAVYGSTGRSYLYSRGSSSSLDSRVCVRAR